jgi:hypothetical protein
MGKRGQWSRWGRGMCEGWSLELGIKTRSGPGARRRRERRPTSPGMKFHRIGRFKGLELLVRARQRRHTARIHISMRRKSLGKKTAPAWNFAETLAHHRCPTRRGRMAVWNDWVRTGEIGPLIDLDAIRGTRRVRGEVHGRWCARVLRLFNPR